MHKISKLAEDRIENRKNIKWMGLQVVRGLGSLHNKPILCAYLKINNLFVFTGTDEPVIQIGDLGSSLRLDAFRVYSSGYVQRYTSIKYASPEMLLARIRKLPPIEQGADIFSTGSSSSNSFGRSTPSIPSRGVGCKRCRMPTPITCSHTTHGPHP